MKTRGLLLLFVVLALFSGLTAGNRNTYPLPEERGTAGTLSALRRLPVYARVLQITAHPDDESAATLTWLSRGFHARTALYSLTRGEGGQNVLGNEKYEELGLLRTGELLAACKYYGTELYFGRAVDFGFSKSAEETLSKWGRRETLEDMVRFIRRWRPTIVISRFRGSPADGHGHHQAAGLLVREAFRAAADPSVLPGQTGGPGVWQVKKLYVSGTPSDWSVQVPVGDYDPVLGRSYREIALEGYSRHRSQGTGAAYAQPGRSFEYFKLLEPPANQSGKEEGFFDSIDTSLAGIIALAGPESAAAAFLQKDLSAVQQSALEALRIFRAEAPEDSAPAVAAGIARLRDALGKLERSSLSPSTRALLAGALQTKLEDFEEALSAVLGIQVTASTQDYTGIPGETVPVNIQFHNRGSEPVSLKTVRLQAPGKISAGEHASPIEVRPGDTATRGYSVTLSDDAAVTEPFWHLGRRTAARYETRQTADEFAAFGSPEILVETVYGYQRVEVPVRAEVRAQAGDPLRGSDFVSFQVVPAVSVLLTPAVLVAPAGPGARDCTFRVSLVSNSKAEARGTLQLLSEAGWRVTPAHADFRLSRKGENFTSTFAVTIPPGTKPGNYRIEAVASVGNRQFRRGYHTISYPENWTRHSYVSADSEVRYFDLQMASHLRVGYVPGAGDEVPAALEQLGITVQTLAASDLAFGDLSRFDAIVTGIRAYNVNEDLRAHNGRLLDYVAQGGTLIVQYVRPMERPVPGAGSPFTFGPYPMSVSDSDRITVEDSPVSILDPENPIFSRPNRITQADFEGWVQERGLYFMKTWDPRYQAVIAGHDPGEEAKAGGMLYARYGKGQYVYSAYSWFRQLPAGVPGAFRIFVNLLSLGSAPSR